MKIIPVLIVVGIINGSAFAQTKQVIGTAGYLSEWEISGTVVTERSSAASDLFAGPVIWKHVGLCSINGPEEKPGEIRLEIRASRLGSRIEANLLVEGDQCVYAGDFTHGASGLMNCTKAKGVPLALSFK